ncbi:MAG: uroporphyrinogen decarboxylase [Deltaproteobacteria bacterium CG11_big_fil_rev_8_21_14_0_20_45_16]|nr:MAG: uroporphyrinogen decarboxylase [Deltaproteobacteria bacterium CG11_big_fil_rev_8_21_14_0_20_45_16]
MLLLDTLELNPTPRRPVWIMRQAGRYLASYRKLREKYSFDDFANQVDLAVQVSLLPLKQYELDAAIVFSDILLPLRCMGLKLSFEETGPVIVAPKTLEDINKLKFEFDPETQTPVIMGSLKELRKQIPKEKALLGFAGAPFTMLVYLLEGELSKDLGVVRTWLRKDPKTCHRLLDFLANAMGNYLDAQARAGADAVQLFDTWASILGPADYEEFALPYARRVISQVTVPSVYYINGMGSLFEQAQAVGAQALSVDWRTPLGEARNRISQVVALQGNLDPYHLLLPRAQLREAVFEMCNSYGKDPGHIVNLGHGIVPNIPEESVSYFIESVHEWSQVLA